MKLSKKEIIEGLTESARRFDPNASYSDLLKLYNENKVVASPQEENKVESEPEPVKTEIVDSPKPQMSPAMEQAAKAREDLLKAVSTQQAARSGIEMAKHKDLHPQQVLEKKIRGLVARNGGWRVGVTPAQIEYGKKLFEQAGRPLKDGDIPQWDIYVALPGYQTL